MSERNDGAREVLVEAVVSPWRERDAHGVIQPHPAWRDLAPSDREGAFQEAFASRVLESALDREGLSATGRVILERALRLPQLPG